MTRSADYTIKGFLYQFHQTIFEILGSEDDHQITVEGIIEDIDITTPTGITAIQCKYHGSSGNFQVSTIYKPLLQMLQHCCENQSSDIRYVLFAHFSIISDPPPNIGKAECESALKSTNKDLKKYVDKISSAINIDNFLSRFEMRFGPSYDILVQKVNDALRANGIPEDSIETLAYPNAVNAIAAVSIKHDPNERKITKKQFLENLKEIRQTAITQWTMALKSKEKLLAAKRKQLKTKFDANKCRRYFIINSKSIEDFDDEIVKFIRGYRNKYHWKTAHLETPLICLTCEYNDIQGIQKRLHLQKVIAEDGYIGGSFEEGRFFREPLRGKPVSGVAAPEFHFRIISWEDNQKNGNVLNKQKGQYLFALGEIEISSLDIQDVEVELLRGMNMKEFQYVIGLSDSHE
ncbi:MULTISPECIES: hypothetical protein [Cyanophyceae]|uniref:hypothetical protein n=1 Tax=Cyanophyceae TaxID=3028117 RepID=UPI001687C0D5|nr:MULTISPECIES: hypothetical protein [Cyanophyceae]MBD1916265.1 hypothetical protein [Phormidium sp. FACHB-77]MBD2028391.1 hypothetical protein [Phormidium sp. FACHB-322]MBD2051870.1 hypothetical protein [Leptolyngbya sp. FACHB-60]